MSGFVTLVGAGPGDPGLLTIKGREAIEQAEVVVYDRLVSPAIMALIPSDAEMIDVGKESSHHKIPQWRINEILLEKGQEGKRVVRLKGGDPFLFGRGGEELELLQEHGIPYCEIPGITSALAVPAYAGIPVTHRDFVSSLHIITGHARAGSELKINFDALVQGGGTLVFLMGVTALPDICAGLLKAGMDPDMPAAVIESGTTPLQRRVDATLGTMPAAAVENKVHSPAIIIVGKVCSLGREFCWFDRLPLRGKRILVTRPADRVGQLSDKLRRLGADVTEFPCIRTEEIPGWEKVLGELGSYGWVCLTSPTAVNYFWNGLRRTGRDARALGGLKLAAVGAATAAELEKHGLTADVMPELYNSDALGAQLAQMADSAVLIPRAEVASPGLTKALDKAGVRYTAVPTYRTIPCESVDEALRERVLAGGFDYAAFTSASTVRGFAAAVGADADWSGMTALSIGAKTTEEVNKLGMKVVTADNASLDDLAALAVRTASAE